MQVLIGDRLRQQRLNAYNALRDGRSRMVQIVARKPRCPDCLIRDVCTFEDKTP